MAYTTKVFVKVEAGIPVATTADDDLIDDLIDAAQKRMEIDCDRVFAASTNTTRYFHPENDVTGRTLWLNRDLASVATVTNGDGTLVTSGQYMVEPKNAVADGLPIYALTLYGNSGVVWTWSSDPDQDQIAVSGKWAYSESADVDVVETLIKLVIWLYRSKDSGNQGDGDRAFMLADGVIILARQLPDFYKSFVARRRRRPMLV